MAAIPQRERVFAFRDFVVKTWDLHDAHWTGRTVLDVAGGGECHAAATCSSSGGIPKRDEKKRPEVGDHVGCIALGILSADPVPRQGGPVVAAGECRCLGLGGRGSPLHGSHEDHPDSQVAL